MKQIKFLLIALALFQISTNTNTHCEVPCGIYNDSVRIQMLYEHISTIEKSMVMIQKWEKSKNVNYNQIVRWVVTKENYSKKIQNIVNQYFMTQRIKVKPDDNKKEYNKYVKLLTLSHKILVYAMKTKQTCDQEYINKLIETVHLFEHVYFGK